LNEEASKSGLRSAPARATNCKGYGKRHRQVRGLQLASNSLQEQPGGHAAKVGSGLAAGRDGWRDESEKGNIIESNQRDLSAHFYFQVSKGFDDPDCSRIVGGKQRLRSTTGVEQRCQRGTG